MRTQTIAPSQLVMFTSPAAEEDAELGPVPAATAKATAIDAAETPATTNHNPVRVRIPSQTKTSQLAKKRPAMASATIGHHRRPFVESDCPELFASASDTAAESVWSRTFGFRPSLGPSGLPWDRGHITFCNG
jgi:hypothetical protein